MFFLKYIYKENDLTIQLGQDFDVGLVEQWQSVVVNVDVRQMGKEVVAHKKAHQHPVVDDALHVVGERQGRLQTNKYRNKAREIREKKQRIFPNVLWGNRLNDI